jgi:group I intron endonuclease
MMAVAFLGFENSLTWLYYCFNSDTSEFYLNALLPFTTCSPALQAFLDKYKLKPLLIFENLHLEETKKRVQESVKSHAGVYLIVNLLTGDSYVGSGITGRIANRFQRHLFGGSGSRRVWNAVLKYGLSNFAFVLVDTVPGVVSAEENQGLLEMENLYIGLLTPEYNIAQEAGNTFGVLHTAESRAAMRANYSSERREAIGALNRGKKLSLSTIEKIREAALNRSPMSDSTRAKVSQNSTVAQLFEVSLVSGEVFVSPEGESVTSTIIRTIPAVANFTASNEKTVRRALSNNGIVKRVWMVKRAGLAKSD